MPDADRDSVNNNLRLTRVGGSNSKQPRQQINHANHQHKKEKSCDKEGNDNPHGGDRGPTSHISVTAEGSDVDQYHQREEQERGQHHRQNDLAR